MLQTVDMAIREVHIGLWFLVVGYYFYIFIFLFFYRWRKTNNPFQLAMSLFFLLLAIGRVFYFVNDYYATLFGMDPTMNIGLQGGAFFQWMALALLSATAGFMIFGKRWAEIAFAIPAMLIAVILALFPLDEVVRQVITGGAGAIYALFIPLLFWYLAWQSGGILRESNFILGLGFFVLFAGRLIHAARDELATLFFGGSITVPGILAPGLIIIALILIASGSERSQSQ